MRYPKYKDSGVEWLGEVPGHWNVVPLKSVATYNDDVLDETTDPDLEILYVDISGVDVLQGIVTKEAMTFGAAPSRARRKVRNGDTIVSTVRTYLRAIAPVRDAEENLVVSTGFAVIRPRVGLEAGVVGYILSASYFIEQVIARSTGVSYPAINASELVRIPVAVPPPREQAVIAAFLDRETAKIDALVGEQRRLIELLKEKRQAVISHAVTKGLDPNAPLKPSGIDWLGDVPAHWAVVQVRRVGTVGQGSAFSQDHQGKESGEIAWFKVADMNREGNDPVMLTAANYVDRRLALELGAAPFPAGTVIFPRVGAALLTNKRRLLGSEAIVDDNTYGIVPTAIVPEYFYLVMLQIDMARLCSPGLVPTVTFGVVKELSIPLPPRPEQQAIVAFIREETPRIQELLAEAARGIELLQERRTALISAAVTGKIDVRGTDVAVEPAEDASEGVLCESA